jgi:hypothetical protein
LPSPSEFSPSYGRLGTGMLARRHSRRSQQEIKGYLWYDGHCLSSPTGRRLPEVPNRSRRTLRLRRANVRFNARTIPIRRTLLVRHAQPPKSKASMAACHSAASCPAFGNFMMSCAAMQHRGCRKALNRIRQEGLATTRRQGFLALQ